MKLIYELSSLNYNTAPYDICNKYKACKINTFIKHILLYWIIKMIYAVDSLTSSISVAYILANYSNFYLRKKIMIKRF